MPTLDFDRRSLHFLDEGSGDPLVLLHGFPLSSAVWAEQVRTLQGRCRVLAPDMAGCGASEGYGDPHAYSVEAWADDVVALVSVLGLERATLIGTGSGADVALAVVRRARDVVGALGLVGARWRPVDVAEDEQLEEWASWIERDGDVEPIVARLADSLVPASAATRDRAVQQARWMMAKVTREGWVGGLRAMRRRPDPTGDLDKIDVPTLVIAGEHDAVAPVDEARAIAATVPGAGVVVVPGAGHLPMVEVPAVVDEAIADLLDGRAARRTTGRHSWPASPAATRTG